MWLVRKIGSKDLGSQNCALQIAFIWGHPLFSPWWIPLISTNLIAWFCRHFVNSLNSDINSLAVDFDRNKRDNFYKVLSFLRSICASKKAIEFSYESVMHLKNVLPPFEMNKTGVEDSGYQAFLELFCLRWKCPSDHLSHCILVLWDLALSKEASWTFKNIT